ncbi:MAG: sulfurtransferase TusA family protein [Chloroflexi bacterium]|nr:sulfurtransferase TusA family protein [Chloroflexota bacterium]
MQVDARGEVCPTPLMMTMQAIKQTPSGEPIVVLIDHAPALDTIPPQARRLGWQVTVEETGDPEWTITLTKP